MSQFICLQNKALKPSVWGPVVWFFCFRTLYDVKLEKMLQFSYLFDEMKTFLFCKFCRESLCELTYLFQLTPLIRSQRFTLIKWLWNIRNMVNIKLGKKVIAYEDVQDLYTVKTNSDGFEQSGWIFLYLIAMTFPVDEIDDRKDKKEKEEKKDRKRSHNHAFLILLQTCTCFSTCLSHPIISNPNLYGKHSQISFFKNRIQAFELIYELDVFSSKLHSSRFGKNLEEVVNSFEKTFRATN